MRVAVLGGYGVFGSRLAELLVRDGHEVWVIGRDKGKAEELAGRIGARLAVIDCRAEPERIFDLAPEAVVDAAGPFQAYDGDPYASPASASSAASTISTSPTMPASRRDFRRSTRRRARAGAGSSPAHRASPACRRSRRPSWARASTRSC